MLNFGEMMFNPHPGELVTFINGFTALTAYGSLNDVFNTAFNFGVEDAPFLIISAIVVRQQFTMFNDRHDDVALLLSRRGTIGWCRLRYLTSKIS